MSNRRRPSRNEQRRARELQHTRGITYQQALDQVRAATPSAGSRPNAGTPTISGAAVRAWIKSLHYRDGGWTIDPGEEAWISDPGRHDASGQRIYRKDGTPAGEPGYRVGDEIGLYFGTTLKVPLVVEVIGPPEFDPEFVQENSYGQESDAGERWPWVTPVKGLLRTPTDRAPDIDYLDIRGPITRQLPHFKLTPDRYQKLVVAFR